MEGGTGSFVEFENRYGEVWRVEWHGAWFLAEWSTRRDTPRETDIEELVGFAMERLYG
ncbi:hypothetical protein [Streptomyces deserti]